MAPDVYLPAFQSPPRTPPIITVLARYDGRPEAAIISLSEALRRAAPDLPAFDIRPVDQRLSDQTATPRLLIRLVSGFSIIALALAALGVYGVVSFTVVSRQREVGIRLAVGASRADVIRAIARTVVLPLVIGLSVGAAAAVGLGRYLESLLYGASPLQPLTLLVSASLMLLTAALALVGPLRRALRTDPRVMMLP
jgi:ABC-type antimicrobial peptide transport system permease subunit